MKKSLLLNLSVVVLPVIVLGPCWAGWSAVDLNPDGSSLSRAAGSSAGRVVGVATLSGQTQAGAWGGSAETWQPLSVPDCESSYARGISGNSVGGYITLHDQSTRACLWNLADGSRVDLGGSLANSQVYAVANGDQVGQAMAAAPNSGYHASLWSGTAESRVDLNPAGYASSVAVGAWGNTQVGSCSAEIAPSVLDSRACLWRGNAESYVNLHPEGYLFSEAYGVYGNQQVGAAARVGEETRSHAGLWSGTAESWLDLNPTGCITSCATAIYGDAQVGFARGSATNGDWHAGLWTGAAGSWVDLHSLLSPLYIESYATGVEVVGDEIWVTGIAGMYSYVQPHAMLWHYTPDTVPEPSSVLALITGVSALGGLSLRRRK